MSVSESTLAARPGLLIGLVVFVMVGLLWQWGVFEIPELWVYDSFVHGRADPRAGDPRIVVVLLKEDDIRKLDYPLRDHVLAEVLEKIESGNPAVIGLDLYRDLPEPRDGSEIAQLNRTFLQYPNIIGIFKYGTDSAPFMVPPPPVLAQDPTRYGFNDFPDQKTIRRALLVMPWGKGLNPYPSFSLDMAQVYFTAHHVDLGQDGDLLRLGKTTFRQFHGSEGGYVNEPDGGYQFLQDYRGPGPDKFDTLSIGDVRALKDTACFKDKIVLIGNGADSGNDSFATPLGDRVAGVVIHAQVVNQMLRAAIDGQAPTIGAGAGVQWAELFGWCVMGVVAGFTVRSHLLFAVAIIGGAGLIVLTAWVLFLHGYWILVCVPAAAFLAAAGASKAYAVNVEEAQRAELMTLFSQHVSSDVAKDIWEQRKLFLQGGRPKPQRLTVTVPLHRSQKLLDHFRRHGAG